MDEKQKRMTSGERANRYRDRQRQAGRKLVTLYLNSEAISKLRKLARKRTTGQVVEQAIDDLWSASYSRSDVKSKRVESGAPPLSG